MRAAGTTVAAVFVVVLLLVGGSTVFAGLIDRVIFQPSPGVDVTPRQLGIEGEEVFLDTEDGVRVHSFFLPSRGATRAVLFLHGNAGNASHRLPNGAALMALGTHVLILDYRGYGRSEGAPSEQGVYADARAALAHLVDSRSVPEERVVLFGRSLGGCVAVDLAVGRALAGVILESTFTSASDVGRQLLGPFSPLIGRRFDSASKIANVRAPLLFFHGDRDRIVDYRFGRRLFDLAPGPKTFETIEGAGHNDTTLVGGRPYFERIRRFLDEVAPPP